MNKPGVWVQQFFNLALWSLAYEWWFYCLFYVTHNSVRRQALQKYVVAGASLAAFGVYLVAPNQLSLFVMYFIIWWSGAELAREYISAGKVTWRGQIPTWSLLAVNALVWVVGFLGGRSLQGLSPGLHPLGTCRHIVSALGLLVLGMLWRQAGWYGFRYTLGVFVHVSAISYGIYVFHFPVLIWAHSLGLPQSWMILVLAGGVTMAAAYLTEVVLQRRINEWTRPWLSGVRPNLVATPVATERLEQESAAVR